VAGHFDLPFGFGFGLGLPTVNLDEYPIPFGMTGSCGWWLLGDLTDGLLRPHLA
jgi:hypothetical protein